MTFSFAKKFPVGKLLTGVVVAYYAALPVVNAEQLLHLRKNTSPPVKTIYLPEGRRKSYAPSIANISITL